MTHFTSSLVRALTGSVLGALFLVGCAVGPDYRKPVTAPVTLASPELASFSNDAVQQDWWRQLQDPQLDALIAQVLARNLDIRVAQARLAESRAILDERQLDQLPTVTMGGQYERSLSQANPGPTGQRNLSESYRAGFDAGWELDLFGRLRRASEGAAARSQASEADLAQTRIVAVAEVARNYYEMRGAEQRLVVARANLDAQTQALRVTEVLVGNGRGDAGDLASARAELATVQASVPPIEASRRVALYRIAVLAALRPAELGELQASPLKPMLVTRLPVGDVSALLQRRPDVLAAERALAAATADVGVATAELYPTINISGFLGFVALRGGDLGAAASRAFSVTPSVEWPGFHLASAMARKRGAEAREVGEMARYQQLVLKAVQELEDAVTHFGETQLRLGALARAAEQSSVAANLAQLRYKEGSAPYLTVLDSQRSLLRAQDAVAQAETASYTSLIAIYKALGGGWSASSAESPGTTLAQRSTNQ